MNFANVIFICSQYTPNKGSSSMSIPWCVHMVCSYGYGQCNSPVQLLPTPMYIISAVSSWQEKMIIHLNRYGLHRIQHSSDSALPGTKIKAYPSEQCTFIKQIFWITLQLHSNRLPIPFSTTPIFCLLSSLHRLSWHFFSSKTTLDLAKYD